MKSKLILFGALGMFVGGVVLLSWTAWRPKEYTLGGVEAGAMDESPTANVSKTRVEQTTVTAGKKTRVQNSTAKANRTAKNVPPVATTAQNANAAAKPQDMKVANALDRNRYLASRLKPLLPAHTTLMDAAAGFKNQRQFIAALHVSKNLDIRFDQIKKKTTSEPRRSLDDSVRELRPDMSKNVAKAEVDKAEAQAKDDEQLTKDAAKKAAAAEKLAANYRS